jgi:transcriptional regulator with XRE-family HTH domain
MPVRQRPGDIGAADARRLGRAAGAELRETRLAIGLSQSVIARASGVSASQLGRLERGETRSPTVEQICRAARALGLAASVKLYPTGSPVRDAAQLALLSRFRALLSPPLSMHREAPIPGEGLRAWDALIDGNGCCFAEGESRLGDVQALARRTELKVRDDPRSSVVILIVARTRHNLAVLHEHRESLRDQFPLDGASIARSLRAGRTPPVSGIIVL